MFNLNFFRYNKVIYIYSNRNGLCSENAIVHNVCNFFTKHDSGHEICFLLDIFFGLGQVGEESDSLI